MLYDPAVSAMSMRNHLKSFVSTEYLGKAILQTITEQARRLAFGDPKTNIRYMEHVIDLAIERGHGAKIDTVSREEAKEVLVLMETWEHQQRRKRSCDNSFPRLCRLRRQTENAECVIEIMSDDSESKYV